MTTREQDNFIEATSLANGGVSLALRDGFADGHVNVTLPSGRSWEVPEDALNPRETLDHSAHRAR